MWVEAEAGLTSLTSFRRQLHFRADKGGPGTGSNKHGANGPDLVIKVGRHLHADMCEDGCRFAAAEGHMAVARARCQQHLIICRDGSASLHAEMNE